MKIGNVPVIPTAKQVLKEFREDDLQGLAAEVAYNILFALVPLLIFVAAITGFVSRQVGSDGAMDSIMSWLFDHMGSRGAAALEEPIRSVVESEAGGALSFGVVFALWGGKNAIAALMKALNVAFGVKETRSWPKRTAIATGLTIALGLAIIAASSSFLLGEQVGEGLANIFGLGDTWLNVWSYLRWPLIAMLLAVGLAFLYWAGPNVDAPFKWLTPGSVTAVVLWGIATFGLGFYFQHFAGYTETYGALGGVLAFVFWIYVMSLILLFGGELNSVLLRKTDSVAATDAPSESAKQRRDAAAPQRA